MRSPLVLDTDIGLDVDDSWALALAMNRDLYDLRLVCTTSGDATARAQVASGLLSLGRRTDVALAVGASTDLPLTADDDYFTTYAQAHPLEDYCGPVRRDGAQAIVDLVMASDDSVVIVAIGSFTTLAEVLALEPQVVRRSRVVAMAGDLRGGGPDPVPEYNVEADPAAARAVLGSDWSVLLAPVDTTGDIRLRDDRFAQLRRSTNPVLQDLFAFYEAWAQVPFWRGLYPGLDPGIESSALFDTLAVDLARSEEFVEIDDLEVEVLDPGALVERAGGATVRAAVRWTDREGFLDHLTQSLL